MFSKYTIALSALILIGGTAVAVAYEEPESKMGDRYPFLEQIDRSAAPNVTWQRGRIEQRPKLNQYINEDVEGKIADRYPLLEQTSPPTTAASTGNQRVQQNAKLDTYVNEDVENKIGDRYPFLDQAVRFAGEARSTATAMRAAKSPAIGNKVSLRRHAMQSNY